MNIYTQDQLKKAFDAAPADVREVLESPKIGDTLVEIIKKYSLSDDEAAGLIDEITYLMIGLEHPKNFTESISDRLGRKIEEIRPLAAEINTTVFHPVRESLKVLYHIGGATKPDSGFKTMPQAPTSPPATKTTTLVQEKLSGVFSIPQTQKTVGTKPPEAKPQDTTPTPAPGSPAKAPAPPNLPTAAPSFTPSADPYRESVDG